VILGHRLLVIVPAFAALAGIASCGGDDPAAPPPADAGATTTQGSVSETVGVDEVAVYQGVKVTLVEDGTPAHARAPIIPGRPALVRIHARGTKGRVKQSLVAELHVKVPGRPDVVVRDGPRKIESLDDTQLHTTFNFELDAAAIAAGSALWVELRAGVAASGDATTARFPAEGVLPMGVSALAPELKVVFVPVQYDADGSGRLPEIAGEHAEAYKQSLYKMYPAASVDVSVRAPLRWPLEVKPDGDGWDSLLDAIIETREDDQAKDDVYYVGVFAPAETQDKYCEGACVLGVAPQAGTWEVGLRVAMILGFFTPHSHGTLAQELAHAMGRGHAPCGGAAKLDSKYPYSSASIGVAGYDLLSKEIIDPESRVFDFMGYCEPVWISDYTWNGIYERMVAVDKTKRSDVMRPAAKTQKTWKAAPDGTIKPGPTIAVAEGASPHEGFVPIAGLPKSRGYVVAPTARDARRVYREASVRRD
jgi:hypothetical protein